jgi:hypothetical protein
VSEDEVGAIVNRLRAEVEATLRATGAGDDGAAPGRLAARGEAERLWAVTADRPFPPWPGWRQLLRRWGWAGLLKRLVVVPVKAVVRKLIRWYVDPIVVDQRRFNEVTLRMIDELAERTAAQEAELVRLRRALAEREQAEGQQGRSPAP